MQEFFAGTGFVPSTHPGLGYPVIIVRQQEAQVPAYSTVSHEGDLGTWYKVLAFPDFMSRAYILSL